LSHAPIPFPFSYFSGRVSSIFPRLTWVMFTLFKTLLGSWNDRHASPHPAFLLRWGTH
jgi:hypothetical protein